MAKQELKKSDPKPEPDAARPENPNPIAVSTVVNDAMFESDANAGREEATAESYAIPFLMVLQKGSPQVDETAGGVVIEGARAGMLFDNIANKLYDGKEGAIIVPCAYRRVFVHWGPREGEGKGFKGEMSPEAVAQLRDEGKIVEVDGKLLFPKPDGTLHEKKCDRASDTRSHYVLVLDPKTGAWTTALLSLTSTQIKKSKALMSMLAGEKIRGKNGLFTPPTFANLVRVTTIPESNEKGSWHGVRFEVVGKVDRLEVYNAAKEFHSSILAGNVAAKYEEGGAAESAAGREDENGSF